MTQFFFVLVLIPLHHSHWSDEQKTQKKQDIVDYSKAQNISLTGYTTLGGVLNKGKSLSTETVKELAGTHS